MPTPVTGVSGPGSERPASSADTIAEARQRHADRLRAAQAEAEKPTEVVEETARAAEAELSSRSDIQPYRVNLDPETARLYTEVVDTETGAIIMRIPAAYVAADEAEETAGDRPAPPELEA